MTEPEIMEMPAGRALDILIAEQVLGWMPEQGGWHAQQEDGKIVWISADTRFPFSTEIFAAWDVVLATRKRDWWWQIESHHGKDGGWQGSVWTDHKSDPEETRAICWDAETPQLAICRAALLGAMNLRMLNPAPPPHTTSSPSASPSPPTRS